MRQRQGRKCQLVDPDAPKVLINPNTIEQARLTMFPLIEAQAQTAVTTDDEPDSVPMQANMLAHAALLLHACKELNIDVTEALLASTYMVGVPRTTKDTVH